MEMQKRIKELRKALGVTQSEFGTSLGFAATSAASWEKKDAQEPAPLAKQMMTRVYGVNLDWLETGEGEMFHAKPEQEPEYPPIIQAALRSYMRLNAQERSALDKFLDALVAEYGDAAKRKAHDDLIDRLSGGETAAAPNGQRVPIITGEHDSVTMARYLAQQDQADLAAEETTHPVAAENS